ncbi:MAG: conjugal transfer protein TraG N-terminal domain-containing protein [Pseudomonadota bacterium]
MQYTIISYGAGEMLEIVFNAITTLINSKSGSLYTPLVRIGLMIGLVWATMSLILGNSAKFFTQWMIPFFLLLTLFFAPTCKLHIKDPTTGLPPYTVDHVPWGLGAFAGTISQISNTVTQKLESVFSLPNDLKYHKTGAVLASNLIAESRQFQITNVDLQETMREFINQCVVYDALLGNKYTMHDLQNSDDIWGLVTANPSPARSFLFKEPGVGGVAAICTCKEGVARLRKYLKVETQSAFQIFGNKIFGVEQHKSKGKGLLNPSRQLQQYLPVSYNYMTGMAKSADAVMRQQMMIHSVIDGIESKSTALGNAANFAVKRAYLQQRANQETLAGVAAKKLIAMKNVMEALIYVAFILVLPLSMLPMGWKFVGRWLCLLLWVQMWPPLYAALNFIMNVAIQSKGIGAITTGNGSGITIANSVGFANLHADMAAQAGFMSLSVGALAYALVRGGAASFVHLAGHLGAPATAAAARASEDLLSGNYSFGNVSHGVMQANNQTFGQQMLSPSYNSGAFMQTDGVVSRSTSAEGGHVVTIANSGLRSAVNYSKSLSDSLTTQATHATQLGESQLRASTKAKAQAYRTAYDLSKYQGKMQSSGDSHSQAQSGTKAHSYNTISNAVNKLVTDHGISKEKSMDLLFNASASVGASLGFEVFGTGSKAQASVGVSGNRGYRSGDRKLYSEALEMAKQANFQKALSDTVNYAKDNKYADLSDQGMKYVKSTNAALDKSKQLREESSLNLQKSESYSKMAARVKQHSGSINSNLNQEYFNWLQRQSLANSTGPMGVHEAETILHSRPDVDHSYQTRFLDEKMQQMQSAIAKGGNFVNSEQQVEELFKQKSQCIQQLDQEVSQGVEQGVEQGSNKPYADKVKAKASSQGFGGDFKVSTATKELVDTKVSAIESEVAQYAGNLTATQQAERQKFDQKRDSTDFTLGFAASEPMKTPSILESTNNIGHAALPSSPQVELQSNNEDFLKLKSATNSTMKNEISQVHDKIDAIQDQMLHEKKSTKMKQRGK